MRGGKVLARASEARGRSAAGNQSERSCSPAIRASLSLKRTRQFHRERRKKRRGSSPGREGGPKSWARKVIDWRSPPLPIPPVGHDGREFNHAHVLGGGVACGASWGAKKNELKAAALRTMPLLNQQWEKKPRH